MQMLPSSRTVAFAAISIGAGTLVGFPGWMNPYRPLEFSGLIVAVLLTSAFVTRQPVAENRGTMPQGFVIEFASLLLLGAGPAMLVASAGVIVKGQLAG